MNIRALHTKIICKRKIIIFGNVFIRDKKMNEEVLSYRRVFHFHFHFLLQTEHILTLEIHRHYVDLWILDFFWMDQLK